MLLYELTTDFNNMNGLAELVPVSRLESCNYLYYNELGRNLILGYIPMAFGSVLFPRMFMAIQLMDTLKIILFNPQSDLVQKHQSETVNFDYLKQLDTRYLKCLLLVGGFLIRINKTV